MNPLALDRLFERLGAVYGGSFRVLWSAAPIEDVKKVWSAELGSMDLKAIAWALQNLPERCPNSIEFRNLCKQAPRPDVFVLPMQAPVTEEGKRLAKQTFAALNLYGDPLAWCKRPKSQKAVEFLVIGAQKDNRLRTILRQHMENEGVDCQTVEAQKEIQRLAKNPPSFMLRIEE
jgi:hypothetical protein